MSSRCFRSLAVAIAALPLTALAQTVPPPPPPQEAPEDDGEIVVTGQRPRGSVVGDIQPELQLGPADIRARGVSSVAELITDLGPQVTSGRGGPPVVLLEGRRISGFREVATLPAEAIARVDILPEEVALKYGYPADQKVVNIVLRQRFKAFTLEADRRVATGGGAFQSDLEFDFLRINRGGRFNLHVEHEHTDPLFESQRGIASGGQGPFRSLIAAQRALTLTATLNRNLTDTVSGTLNGELKTTETTDQFGLPATSVTTGGVTSLLLFPGYEPLARDASTQTARAATTLNGTLANWRWTFTGSYDHAETRTLTDRGLDPGLTALLPTDQARTNSDTGQLDVLVSGSPFRLPAGEASLTVRGGASFIGFRSSANRAGVASATRLSRDDASGQVNLDLPVASRRSDVLAFLGDLSLNGNVAVDRYSDFGTLVDWGAGFNWGPFKALDLIGSFSRKEDAPTPQQLGNAVIVTPNVRVFDFVRGTDALVALTTGGNPGLQASRSDIFRLGATLKPIKADLTLTADFTDTRVRNPISALPPASLTAQLAFPGRFGRDAAGNLVSVDNRTVNFARTSERQLRTGINFSKPLKTSQAQVDALRAAFRARFPNGRPGGGPGAGGGPGGGERGGAGAGGRGPGGGGFGGGAFGGGGGRLNLALYHTVYFTDSVTLADGQPPLDLLSGDTIGSGGQPRHLIEVQAGYSNNGYGFRLTGNWQSATRVRGATAAQDLRFSDLGTVNLRAFANLTQMFPKTIKSAPWLAGVRVTLGVNNIFDSRQRVTDASGATPTAYLPGYLDPLGRTVRISIRKLLF